MLASILSLLVCALILTSDATARASNPDALRAMHLYIRSSDDLSTFDLRARQVCAVPCSLSCCNAGEICIPGGCSICPAGTDRCFAGEVGCCPAGTCSSVRGECNIPCAPGLPSCGVGHCCGLGQECVQGADGLICQISGNSPPARETTPPPSVPTETESPPAVPTATSDEEPQPAVPTATSDQKPPTEPIMTASATGSATSPKSPLPAETSLRTFSSIGSRTDGWSRHTILTTVTVFLAGGVALLGLTW